MPWAALGDMMAAAKAAKELRIAHKFEAALSEEKKAIKSAKLVLAGKAEIIITDSVTRRVTIIDTAKLTPEARAELAVKMASGAVTDEGTAATGAKRVASIARITPAEYEKLAFGHIGKKETFRFPWSEGNWQTRHVDDWIKETGTIQEATLLEWSSLNLQDVHSLDFQEFNRKLKQAAQDGWLLKNDRRVKEVIWYGTEPLPTTGRAAELTRLLTANGIQYRLVKVPR